MTAPIRILLVEDDDADARLVVRALQQAGLAVDATRVETEDAMRGALSQGPWDLVITDWSLPSFSARAALALLHETRCTSPAIVISGSVGEETAVEAMRAGARDFVVKDRLARLAPAVLRELDERDALRRSEHRFARLYESGIVGIAIADVQGRVHDANDAYLRMLGHDRAELERGEVRWDQQTPPEWTAADELALAQLRTAGLAPAWEKELFRKDGTRVPVLLGVAMLEPPMCITFVADLSERRRAQAELRRSEERLRHAQQLEALGSLAGGVAHDFNNLLSVIISYTELSIQDLPHGDPMRGDLTEVLKASQRAVDLTRQLLAFSRRQVLQPRVVQLEHTLTGMEKMLRRLIGEHIELALAIHPPISPVRVDPGQIEQVIMNLAVNARDAMPRGGRLTLELADVLPDEGHPAGSGRRVMLAVTDTGTGMDADVRARAFEPFFTTKPTGKGTGLGLATVHGIVVQSGGTVALESEPGRGTTFRIHFPPTASAAGSADDASGDDAADRGTGTILLVEDDDALRAVTRTILTRHGYAVLDAKSGGDALVIAEKAAGKLDLLLTDVVMPLMSGRELAGRLEKRAPGLRVLYMSGYTDDEILRHGVREARVAFMQKPVTPQALLRKVRETLR